MFESRVKKIQERLAKENVEALLVTRAENKRYLTNFSGSTSWVIITASDRVLILVDGRYTEQAREECPSFVERIHITDYTNGFPRELPSLLHQLKIKRLGVEAHQMTLLEARRIEEDTGAILVSTTGWVEGLRMRKSPDEVESLKEAIRAGEEACQKAIECIRPGVDEIAVAHEIVTCLSSRGLKESFESIVASGERSAMPHGRPSRRKIGEGDVVVIDMGALYKGYHSDITRTICVGKAGDEQRKVFELLQRAQAAAYKVIRPGVLAKEPDLAARKVIADAGYGEHFSHGLGHGVGLEIHEAPTIRRTSDQVLEAGMAITVEPGVYIPGKFGMRLEDDVLVTENGCELLTTLPQNLSSVS